MEKVPDLDTFLKKMNKEIILKDLNNRNYHIKDFKRFKNMNERNLILKVLKLDRDIYDNLLQSNNSFQLLLPLFFIYQFISYFVTKILSINYLRNFLF